MRLSLRAVSIAALVVVGFSPGTAAQAPGFGPGARVLLDAHNAYPYDGRFADRVPRALATGLPVAIEQDLIWRVGADGKGESVVGHDVDKVADAPSFEAYFFGAMTPVIEQALRENRRDQWPVIVLNLDFKTNEPAHHARVREVLSKHKAWLTSAPRTATPDQPSPLTVAPILVLTGSDASQQTDFHDNVPVGEPLWLFGAIAQPEPAGETARDKALALAKMAPETLIAQKASNYRRWVNFPWHVVEAGGQPYAAEWTAADRTRLDALVSRAHGQGLWIRFYTLNGHPAADADKEGWSKGYNFGSIEGATVRWKAVRDAKVDFVATDQYEAFTARSAQGVDRTDGIRDSGLGIGASTVGPAVPARPIVPRRRAALGQRALPSIAVRRSRYGYNRWTVHESPARS